MSIETQAILAGHIAADRIAWLVESNGAGKVAVRDMHRPEYKLVEFEGADGTRGALNLFLESWAAEDYADAFSGPSTLLTIQYSPQNFGIVSAIVAALGGMVRKNAQEPWAELSPALG